jgi:hypothetical protein
VEAISIVPRIKKAQVISIHNLLPITKDRNAIEKASNDIIKVKKVSLGI